MKNRARQNGRLSRSAGSSMPSAAGSRRAVDDGLGPRGHQSIGGRRASRAPRVGELVQDADEARPVVEQRAVGSNTSTGAWRRGCATRSARSIAERVCRRPQSSRFEGGSVFGAQRATPTSPRGVARCFAAGRGRPRHVAAARSVSGHVRRCRFSYTLLAERSAS
jgi:hypothetical protein